MKELNCLLVKFFSRLRRVSEIISGPIDRGRVFCMVNLGEGQRAVFLTVVCRDSFTKNGWEDGLCRRSRAFNTSTQKDIG